MAPPAKTVKITKTKNINKIYQEKIKKNLKKI
jgi:hypothetical protein